MENSYGIGIQNRYELFFNEEADPFDLVKAKKKPATRSTEEKENKKGAKSASNKKAQKTEDVVPTKTSSDKSALQGKGQPAPQQQQPSGPRNGEHRVKFSDREERNNRRNRPDSNRDLANGSVSHQQRGENDERPRTGRRFDGERNRRFEEDGTTRRFNSDGGAPRRFADGERRFDGESRGGGRGRGMGRGGGRGRGAGAGGKREFDRHSGSERSGVKAVDKRDGSGSYNWGSNRDQIEETQNADQVQTTELDTSAEDKEKATPASGEEGAASGAEESSGEAGPKEDEEPQEMTLDEYRAQQKQVRSKPSFNVRKAGEGENNSQWKKTYVLKKKVDESDDEEELSDGEEEHHGKKKTVLNIDFQFADSPMRGRGRGRGRGNMGGRGGRGMGGGRGGGGGMGYGRGGRSSGPGRQVAPKMDDEGDFPSLKGK